MIDEPPEHAKSQRSGLLIHIALGSLYIPVFRFPRLHLSLKIQVLSIRDPKKHISISIL